MIKKVTRGSVQKLYQIQIPKDQHRYLLQVDSNDDHPVVDFLKEYCPKEWEVLYAGHRYTIIGRKKSHKAKPAATKAIY